MFYFFSKIKVRITCLKVVIYLVAHTSKIVKHLHCICTYIKYTYLCLYINVYVENVRVRGFFAQIHLGTKYSQNYSTVCFKTELYTIAVSRTVH